MGQAAKPMGIPGRTGKRNVMKLKEVLRYLQYDHFSGDSEVEFREIAYDSRAVKKGDLFVAIRGWKSDGHLFLDEAQRSGAAAVVVADADKCPAGIPCIGVVDTREALAQIAFHYYHPPFDQMNLIGITGTNGKTTTTYLLESILANAGRHVGVIGTVNYRFPGAEYKAPVTTPESLDLMQIMRRMADQGVGDVVLEVSSHALHQGRTRGCPFTVAVFTNISRDHLDYHGSEEAYFEAKSRLFTALKESRSGPRTTALINMDDPWGARLKDMTPSEVVTITYGLQKKCDVRAVDVKMKGDGIEAGMITPKGEMTVRSSLIGDFNVYNLMAATGAALALGVAEDEIPSGIAALAGVPGRLERVKNSAGKNIVVDYAHTPDALSKAIQAVRPYAKERVISVFGCGGDRDKGKRREMGHVAARLSDRVILTSDNPRSEEPNEIIAQIEEGVRLTGMISETEFSGKDAPQKAYWIMPDRAEAIRMAVRWATPGDVVLIAGKGHETYQIVGQEVRDFDDRLVAAEAAS
jgi:UDP-N-acetylmuramoyl-L-alanyl-D-glutamate--2,6-diaminopimelate ligase